MAHQLVLLSFLSIAFISFVLKEQYISNSQKVNFCPSGVVVLQKEQDKCEPCPGFCSEDGRLLRCKVGELKDGNICRNDGLFEAKVILLKKDLNKEFLSAGISISVEDVKQRWNHIDHHIFHAAFQQILQSEEFMIENGFITPKQIFKDNDDVNITKSYVLDIYSKNLVIGFGGAILLFKIFSRLTRSKKVESKGEVNDDSQLLQAELDSQLDSLPIKEEEHDQIGNTEAEQKKCGICYLEAETVFALIPCGHCLCEGCVADERLDHTCPYCRGRFYGSLKVHI